MDTFRLLSSCTDRLRNVNRSFSGLGSRATTLVGVCVLRFPLGISRFAKGSLKVVSGAPAGKLIGKELQMKPHL